VTTALAPSLGDGTPTLPGVTSPSADPPPDSTLVDSPPPAAQRSTLYVDGGRLYDACGEALVIRGVNQMSIWIDPTGALSFAEIAKTGANSVRIVWDTSGSAAGLEHLVALALSYGMLPTIEVHGATGNLSLLPAMVDYWLRPDVLAVIKKYERTLIVNIANEAAGVVSAGEFVSAYTSAVTRMRAAGIEVPLMIDAPRWGQDIAVMQATAPALQSADPLHNLVFSVHVYWTTGSVDIAGAFDAFFATGQPLIVGEFAANGIGCGSTIDYRGVITQAQRLGIGWYAWDWGPGNTACNLMDMTTNNSYASLHGWGLEVAVTDPSSIQHTSKLDLSVLSPTCGR
jgi:mannan endo-1,4-beta-mannosidase